MAMWSTYGWPGTGLGASHPSNTPPSRAHSYSAASVEEKTNAALVLVVVAFGPETIVVSGNPPAAVHDHSSIVWPTIPSGLTARTSRMCSPPVRPVSSYGDGQPANGPRSSAHSKVEPLTVEEKTNLAVEPLTSASGPETIVTTGASRSEEHTSELQSQSNLVCRLLLETKMYLNSA